MRKPSVAAALAVPVVWIMALYLVPLAVGDATDTLFGSIALATAGGTLFGTIGAMWVLPLMLMPLRRPRMRWHWLAHLARPFRWVWQKVPRRA